VTRVLVIDDEEIVRELVAEVLRRAGYDVLTAEAPDDARGHLDDPALALVLSDLVMPGLSGLELLDELRGRRHGLPVLLMTGAGTGGTTEIALASGAAGLLRKPFSHSELREAVAAALAGPSEPCGEA